MDLERDRSAPRLGISREANCCGHPEIESEHQKQNQPWRICSCILRSMFRGDRLFYAALGVATVLGIALGLVIADFSDPVSRRIPYGDAAGAKADFEARRRASTPDDALGWIGPNKKLVEKSSGEKSQEKTQGSENQYNALNLEAQWAAVAASERVARLTVWQIWIGAFGVAAVCWSLIYTRRAVQEASKASRAAEESTELSRINFEKIERPYIYIFGPKTFFIDPRVSGGLEPWAEYCVANFGRTPARCETVLCEMIIVQTDEPSPPSPAPPDNNVVINPIFEPERRYDGTRIKAIDDIRFFDAVKRVGELFTKDPILLPTERLYFQMWIIYRGAIGGSYETRASWIWDSSVAQFVYFKPDDSKYNKMT